MLDKHSITELPSQSLQTLKIQQQEGKQPNYNFKRQMVWVDIFPEKLYAFIYIQKVTGEMQIKITVKGESRPPGVQWKRQRTTFINEDPEKLCNIATTWGNGLADPARIQDGVVSSMIW